MHRRISSVVPVCRRLSSVVLSNSEDHPSPNYRSNFYHTSNASSSNVPFLNFLHCALPQQVEIEIQIQEIASMLIAFDRHHDWMSKEVKIRPKSGSMLLYSRKKVILIPSLLLWYLPALIFRFVTAETATAGRRGRTERQPGRTT